MVERDDHPYRYRKRRAGQRREDAYSRLARPEGTRQGYPTGLDAPGVRSSRHGRADPGAGAVVTVTRLELAEAMVAQARAAAEANPDSAQAAANLASAQHRVSQEKRAAHTTADGLAAPDPTPGTPEPGDAL